jgi:hypothetical protein
VRAVTVSDVHILAQAMINAAPDGHKKVLIFADSRQDAAFQAGWMQDHGRRIRLRHMMYQVIADGTRGFGGLTRGISSDGWTRRSRTPRPWRRCWGRSRRRRCGPTPSRPG